jgi:hypothetical protein
MELKLSGGGIVERNAALMEGDIVYVILKNEKDEPKDSKKRNGKTGKNLQKINE